MVTNHKFNKQETHTRDLCCFKICTSVPTLAQKISLHVEYQVHNPAQHVHRNLQIQDSQHPLNHKAAYCRYWWSGHEKDNYKEWDLYYKCHENWGGDCIKIPNCTDTTTPHIYCLACGWDISSTFNQTSIRTFNENHLMRRKRRH
jgi:hypothetical protein